jgi:hypothetical protein
MIVKEVIGAVGKAFPNEGFNRAIKDAMARTISIDPFPGLSQIDSTHIPSYKLMRTSSRSAAEEVTIRAILVIR